MNFGQYLSKSWEITWKHKVLWIFGILAALGSGNRSGNFNFNFGGGNRGGVPPVSTPFPPGGAVPTPPAMPAIPPDATPFILIAACVVIVVVIVLFVLGIIGTGGLIGGIRLAEEQGAVTFGEAWVIGTHNFLRLFGLKLLLLVPILLFVCIAVAGGTFLAIATLGIGLICLVPLICILVIAFIPIGIVAHFAQFAVVLENMGPIDAFKRGWAILKANLANILILGVIVIVITAVIGFVLALPFIIIALPIIFSVINSQTGTPDMGPLAIAALCCACYLPVVIVLSGILESWSTGVWTLSYREFAGNTPAPAMPGTPTPPMTPLAPLPPLPPTPPTTPPAPPVMPS